VTSGGVFRAASIKTAEAAKVIENAQRDINIAFMNEITQIFSKLDMSIWDVLEAAGTKWNFLPFQPGLVGGHCIGVDPYYLSHRAQQLGHRSARHPRRPLDQRRHGRLGRRQPPPRARRTARLGARHGARLQGERARPRNSKVIDVIRRLEELGHEVTVHDPLADPDEARHEYGVELAADALDSRYDLVVVAVAHRDYAGLDDSRLAQLVADGGLLADLKNLYGGRALAGVSRWTLSSISAPAASSARGAGSNSRTSRACRTAFDCSRRSTISAVRG
jgi:UDP-N-acetyl-D-galactosamine dehydrogenase